MRNRFQETVMTHAVSTEPAFRIVALARGPATAKCDGMPRGATDDRAAA
jgi:hypothetical protein